MHKYRILWTDAECLIPLPSNRVTGAGTVEGSGAQGEGEGGKGLFSPWQIQGSCKLTVV
jgi:hypothetical protein